MSPNQEHALVLALSACKDAFGWMPRLTWSVSTWDGVWNHHISKTTALSLERRGLFERGRKRQCCSADPWPYYFRLTPEGWKVAQELDSKQTSVSHKKG